MTEALRSRPGTSAALLMLVLLAACGQVESAKPTEAPITDPTQLYTRLTLNYNAINLTADSTVPAYNEVQLVATPYDGTGTVIADAPAATFTTSDTAAIRLDPSGLLHAKQAANQVKIVATLVLGAVRHTDTATVNITDVASPPALDTFSIHVPSDSAVWYVPSQTDSHIAGSIAQFVGLVAALPSLPVRAVDAQGNSIASSLAISYTSLDSALAVVDRWSGTVTPLSAGQVPIVAQTFAYGVAKTDTMTYAVNAPFSADILIDRQGFFYLGGLRRLASAPATPTLRIAAGGIVAWFSFTAQPMDVTFDDPTNVTTPPAAFCNLLVDPNGFGLPAGPYCSTGNIPTVVGDSLNPFPNARFRQFPVPGTYPYHSTTTGAAGLIVVLDRVTPRP